jgi:hypothetical protein
MVEFNRDKFKQDLLDSLPTPAPTPSAADQLPLVRQALGLTEAEANALSQAEFDQLVTDNQSAVLDLLVTQGLG